MNRYKIVTKPLMWFMALLLVAVAAGCNSGSSGGGAAATSAKDITAYSLGGTIGTINQVAKTITVVKPSGTNVTALVATFVTSGVSVKVGTSPQTSGVTFNNFTSPVVYTVTAIDGTSANYSVAVNMAAAASPACTGGANCVPLGVADNFVILAKTMITGSGSSITGNIGVSPAAGSTITVPCASMLTGKVYQVDDSYADAACAMSGTVGGGVNKSTVDTAVANMGTAYTDAAGRTVPAPTIALGTGNISGMTLTPGIYKWSTGVLIYAGNPNAIAGGDATGVTLDCTTGGSTSVFIFQIAAAQTLTLGQSGIPASINLTNGCLASNIFWQVGGNVNIVSTSVFRGNILTATQVAMDTGATLHGRALAQTAVTLLSNTVGQ